MTPGAMNSPVRFAARTLLGPVGALAFTVALTGCAKREKVLEINTPGGEVEVEKTTHPNGDVDLKVETEKK